MTFTKYLVQKIKKETKKMFVDAGVDVFQKGKHVLVISVNRKLPAVLGDKVSNDDTHNGDYVEVSFFTHTKDKG